MLRGINSLIVILGLLTEYPESFPMRIQGAKELRKSKRGNMPFAMVAVALLLTSSAFCIVYANIGDTKESTGSITEELNNMDDAITEAERFIESGLGNIIYQISADHRNGTMIDRSRMFDSLVDEWFQTEFPRYDRGMTVEIVEEDIGMDIQTTKVSANDLLAERSVASYLRAVGTVKATFTGTAGTATKTLQITADGTSGLPFIVDCATKFELSTEGDASLLTQLVSYQLSSLAQSRVVNGYGLRSVSGGMGAVDIITKADVEKAFRNALTAVETICFRDNSTDDRTFFDNRHVDLAEMMVLKDGFYEIDVGAILSQALLSMIDKLVVRWVDYLGVNKIFELFDNLLDFATEVVNNVVGFFTGNQEDNRNSARIYIKDAMSSCGYSEEDYRYVLDNAKLHFSKAIDFEYRGNMVHYEIGDIGIPIECVHRDILGWGGWENYVTDYERNRNKISDYIRGTLQSICSLIASGYGILRIPADAFDSESFMESYMTAVYSSLDGCLDRLTYEMESRLREDNVTDMLLATIYQTMIENRDAIFGESNIVDDISFEMARGAVICALSDRMMVFDEVFYPALAIAKDDPQVKALASEYSRRVDAIYELYGSVLNNSKNQNNNIMKELVISAGKNVMKLDFVKETVAETARGMMAETMEHIRMNSGYGVLELEGKDGFTLSDGYGGIYEEFADIIDSYTLKIDIVSPDRNTKNVHSISTKAAKLASYVSVITVNVKGTVDYTAHSMSGVDKSLGRFDSEFRDVLNIDMKMDISCVSGWSLTGAAYRSSTNIFNDAWNILLKALEPLLGPLQELYEALKEIFGLCYETVMEINAYATELIDKLFSAVMEPLDALTEMISECIAKNLCYVVENLCGCIQGFDIGASKQKITFTFFGLLLTVELRAATLLKTTKNIVKLTLEGNIGDTKFSAFIDMKKNTKDGLMVRCGGGVENADCALDLTFDPEMKFGSKLVTLSGTIREVDIEACLPYKVMYDEFELALSDIPGVSESISNIPLPIPGYKCGFDMGIDLKYNLPITTGLMINEFETNPAGTDNGTEWVELYNATSKTIDLSGYMLVPESNESKAFVITGNSISPFEKKVIMFEKQSLNNSKSGKHNGESVSLYSPDGKKVDSTPWKKDTYNDDRTWQRKADGSTSWVFIKGTPGSSNGSLIKTNALAKEFLIDCFLKAADRAFEEMGNHLKSVDDIAEFLHRTLQLFIKNVIDTIAEIVVSASVYILVELTDYAQTQHYGLKVAFEMNSDLVREGIYWLLKQLNILQDVVREPCCNDIGNIVCENTYLTTTVYTSISTPKFLATLESEEIEIGYKAGVNITGLSDMIWGGQGKWKAILGVVAEDLDASKLPKGLRSDKDKRCDLWLIKVELCKSDSPKTG